MFEKSRNTKLINHVSYSRLGQINTDTDTFLSSTFKICTDTLMKFNDGTPPNPSTIDAMVGSPSKKKSVSETCCSPLETYF